MTKTDEEVALEFYELALSQYLVRIKQRDGVLLFYAAASGTVAGFSLGQDAELGVLILIPFMAGASSIIMAYQSFFVEAIANYASEELGPQLQTKVVPFLLSKSFASLGIWSVFLRTFGNLIILLFPALAATVALAASNESVFEPWLVNGAGIAAVFGALLFSGADGWHILQVHRRYRARIHSKGENGAGSKDPEDPEESEMKDE